MDLSRTRVVLRERAVVDVLDLALRFLVEHGAVYAKTALLVLPPYILGSLWLARAFGPVAGWAFAIFFAGHAGAPFTVIASRLVFEDDVRIFQTLLLTGRVAMRLFLVRLVIVSGGLVGAVFFVFPGVWFLSLSLFVVEVTTLEHAAPAAALSRSLRLALRESGAALMALLLLTMLHFVVVLAADIGGRTIISALLETRPPEAMWGRGWSVLSLLGFWLFVPYAATARFLVYIDIRTRSEGWDIQTRFTALATRAEARTAA